MGVHEEHTDATGRVIFTHPAAACDGFPCPVHRPSAHHMRDWPQIVRTDRAREMPYGGVFVLTERECPHGIGHPDPDSIDYAFRNGGVRFAQTEGVHGCDCCCADPDERTCGHCGHVLAGFGFADGVELCHSGTVPPEALPQDCYRLVTVYGHPADGTCPCPEINSPRWSADELTRLEQLWNLKD